MPPINLSFGVEGLRQSDYKLHLISEKLHDLSDTLSYLQEIFSNTDEFDAEIIDRLTFILAESTEIGELRRDSISLSCENGNSLEGNNVGEISLGKQCSFEAELINSTVENINDLFALDGTGAFIILEEINNNSGNPVTANYTEYEYSMMKRYIFIGNTDVAHCTNATDILRNIKITDKVTGGDVPRVVISMSDNVSQASDFRQIKDIIHDCVTLGSAQTSLYNGYFSDNLPEIILNHPYGLYFSALKNGISEDDIEFIVKSGVGNETISPESVIADVVDHILSFRITLPSTGFSAPSSVKFRFKPTATVVGYYSMWVDLPFVP